MPIRPFAWKISRRQFCGRLCWGSVFCCVPVKETVRIDEGEWCFWLACFLIVGTFLLCCWKNKTQRRRKTRWNNLYRLVNYDPTYLETHDDRWMACANLSLPFGKRPRYLGGLCGIARRHQWWGLQQYLRSGDLERTTVPATQPRLVKGWIWRFLKFGNLKFKIINWKEEVQPNVVFRRVKVFLQNCFENFWQFESWVMWPKVMVGALTGEAWDDWSRIM